MDDTDSDERPEPVGPPPSDETRDTGQAVVRAGVGLTPFVGGPLAELVNVMMDKAIPRRREEWFKKVGESVDYMVAHSITIEGLADNETFVTVLQEATEAAAKTHEEEKLEALRNSITNSALGVEPDEHMQIMFVRFVSEFTALHLRILAFFRDPGGWFDGHGIKRPSYYMGGRGQVLEDGIPELRARKDIYTQAINELSARGLMAGGVSGMVSEQGMWQSITSPLGNRFLDFIANPK